MHGISTYPKLEEIEPIVNAMKQKGITTLRASFNPSFISGTHPYDKRIIQKFLDVAPQNFKVIVDRIHLFTTGQSGNEAQLKNNLQTAYSHTQEVINDFKNNSRVWIETVNEYPGTDQQRIHQNFIDFVRARCTNPVGFNKFRSGWYDVKGPAFAGDHYYFGPTGSCWSVASAIRDVKAGIARGYNIINTECGASWEEASGFTPQNVNYLNEFIRQSSALNSEALIWNRYGLQNWQAYESFGLTFPTPTAPGIEINPEAAVAAIAAIALALGLKD